VTNLEPLLTLSATPELLHTSPATVVRYVNENLLHCIVIRKGQRKVTRRFSPSTVATFIKSLSG
jgi:hypothetical protein